MRELSLAKLFFGERELGKTTVGVSNAVTSSRRRRVVRLLKAQCVFMCPLTLQS